LRGCFRHANSFLPLMEKKGTNIDCQRCMSDCSCSFRLIWLNGKLRLEILLHESTIRVIFGRVVSKKIG
jgi:hypothetical protein